MVYHRILNIVPVLYHRCLSILYNSLHLLIPNSQSFPSWHFLPLDNHSSVLCVCESISALQVCSFVSYFTSHIYTISWSICLSLSDLISLRMVTSRPTHIAANCPENFVLFFSVNSHRLLVTLNLKKFFSTSLSSDCLSSERLFTGHRLRCKTEGGKVATWTI